MARWGALVFLDRPAPPTRALWAESPLSPAQFLGQSLALPPHPGALGRPSLDPGAPPGAAEHVR